MKQSNKTRLLHIQLLPLLSGVQNVMLQLLDNIDREKYDIYIICKPGGPLVDEIQARGYNYLAVRSLRREFSILDVISFFHIFILMKKYKFDIVHTHSSKTGFLGRIAAKLCGTKKIIHTVHGFPFHPYQRTIINKFYQILEKFAAKFCSNIVFVNQQERLYAISKGIVTEKQAITIYNGIKPQTQIQKHYNSDLTIGSVCRFESQKNIIDTVKAAIQVCKQREDIRFIFVGDGELYNDVEKMIKESGLTKRISLTGWSSDVGFWFKKFDIFLLYSKWEGLSISILEAMSFGLPIIASDIKGNNELVSEKNGILVTPDNLDALISELKTLPDRKDIFREWGRNSYKLIQNKFSEKEFVKGYTKLYEF